MKVEVERRWKGVAGSERVKEVAEGLGMKWEGEWGERFEVECPGMDEAWKVGAIVGPSGSGKTTVAKAVFGSAVRESYTWKVDEAAVDGCGGKSVEEAAGALTAVGLGSPPAWIKPYGLLSRGQQFRCDLARGLLEGGPVVVCDEFTSALDRESAWLAAAAVGKGLRDGRFASRFVAVGAHRDVLEWLEPDWVLDMSDGRLHWGRLRRPRLRFELYIARQSAWGEFRRHHYLDGRLNPFSTCFLAAHDGRAAAFAAVLPLAGKTGWRRVSRLVVAPEYQGLGLGRRFLTALAERFAVEGKHTTITTGHPALTAALGRDPDWRVRHRYSKGGRKGDGGIGAEVRRQKGLNPSRSTGMVGTSQGRSVTTMEYVGMEAAWRPGRAA